MVTATTTLIVGKKKQVNTPSMHVHAMFSVAKGDVGHRRDGDSQSVLTVHKANRSYSTCSSSAHFLIRTIKWDWRLGE